MKGEKETDHGLEQTSFTLRTTLTYSCCGYFGIFAVCLQGLSSVRVISQLVDLEGNLAETFRSLLVFPLQSLLTLTEATKWHDPAQTPCKTSHHTIFLLRISPSSIENS